MKKKYNIISFSPLKIGLVAFLMCGWLTPSEGQTLPRDEYFNNTIEQRPFNAEEWKNLTKDLNYEEDGAIKEDPNHRKANTTGTGEEEEEIAYTPGQMSPFWAAVFKFLVVGMAIAVLVILLYNILGNGSLFSPRGRKVQEVSDAISIEAIEANIHESDLDRHIRQAIEQQNYTLAIRLYYLAVIKELSLHKWIKWKREKTNRDYLREMRPNNLFQPYQEATRIFERVWYGKGLLQESDFNLLRPNFIELLNEIKRTNV